MIAWHRKLWLLRRANAHAVTRGIGERLKAEKSALETFTSDMEQEFLSLGALLRKITALGRDVRSRSDEVISAAAGHTEDAALQFAFQLLKKAEDLVIASREQHAAVCRVFEQMHVDLRKIARERAALMRTLSPLESTNTQFRIQACAFNETTRAQFFALADSIRAIVCDVQTAVGQRFEELERTGKATGELVTRLSALAATQKTETEAMLDDSRDHLARLNQALHSSEAVAQSMAECGSRITGGVNRAIVALQCQDMARQKFQHICAAMDEMSAHLASDEGGDGHYLRDASRIQLGQLRTVFAQLDEAAQNLQQGLNEVESETRRFTEHAVQAGGTTLDGRVISRAIESIHAVLGVIQNAVGNIVDVVSLVHKLKSAFSDCTNQILGLALRLRIVALNAQICAAHVEAGAALEVVAANTRTVADEAMQQLDEISLRVTELVDAVVDLEQRLSDYGELASIEKRSLEGEAGQSETKLRALDQELREALTAIGPLEKALSAAIQTTTAAIRFPARVAAASRRSTALFEEISGMFLNDACGPAAPHRKLEALKSNYTMEHEREVHQSALGPAAEAPPAQPLPDQEEKLTDNVEFF